MSLSKPSIPKGTRDFTPMEMIRRNHIFQIIRSVFQSYGYLPVETPAMENLSTLLGKYGDEGDKLLFRVLNSGDFLSSVDDATLMSKNSQALSSLICDRGLRYDLTVPFARFVVQHRNEINFPFKRYQIQPVWRADRPQKGRYREFYQCDADVIGSDSLINEADLCCMVDEVFSRLGIAVEIRLNNRKILAGIAEVLGQENNLTAFTVALDKLDKSGSEKVLEELRDQGFNEEAINRLIPLMNLKGDFNKKFEFLRSFFNKESIPSVIGLKGIEELEKVFSLTSVLDLNNGLVFDLSLARGLNYYTGAIIEVKAKDMEIGSVCGGGRYDDLTGIFGLPGVSGVGISFGADRIYDVLNHLNLFPEQISSTVRLMFVNFGEAESRYIFPLLKKIRMAGINAEVYPDDAKMKKQMNYANSNNIPFVAIVGEEEMTRNVISVKEMSTGEQKSLSLPELLIFPGLKE